MEKKLQCGMIIALFFASFLVLVSCTAVYTNAAGQEVDASYTISYNLNGGSWADGYTAATSFTASTAVTLPGSDSVVYSGYTFGGWYTDSAFTGGNEITGWSAGEKTADVTVYAKWTAITYTIAYDANNSSASGATGSQSCTYGTEYTIAANGFTLTGYSFTGWNTVADGTGTSYAAGDIVTNLSATAGTTITLYALWTANKIESITVSAPTYSSTDLNLTSSTSGTTTTFSVDSGYASYVWLYEGTVMQSSSSNTWALDRSGSSPTVTTGKHQILVIATATGSANSYSASCTYTYTVTE
jgi:uncharacterized repeat protein (TIGR02543 family)